jgi:DNA-binding MarR family transcriptional regulator
MTAEAGAPVVVRDGEMSEAVAATQALFAAVVGLFHRLRVLAEQIHDQEGMTAGLRSILFELDRSGPRTVPQMARARPVARQHIQGLVDQLRARRLVDLKENPAHRRSHMVRLTAAGQALVASMNSRETEILERPQIPVPTDDLLTSTEVLRTIRELLAQPDVQRLLAATRPVTTSRETANE